MDDYYCCVRFSFSVLSQEIGWEERLRNDIFCCRVGRKTLTNQSNLDPCSLAVARGAESEPKSPESGF